MNGVILEYYEWLLWAVLYDNIDDLYSYSRLMRKLFLSEFRWTHEMDKSRAINGIEMRRTFAMERNYDLNYISSELSGPCNMLEMLVALSVRCEQEIMSDPDYGDRTGLWFWTMLRNLGLSTMTNDIFDEQIVDFVLDRLEHRTYEADGLGGLVHIENCPYDLRKIDIWYQMGWYLETLEKGEN